MAGFVQISGLKAVNEKLKAMTGAEGKKAIRKGLRRGAKPLVALAKELEVKGPTLLLSRAIKLKATKRSRGKIMYTVGFSETAWKKAEVKYYGVFRELGTRKIKSASLAMRRAYLERGEIVKGISEHAIWDEVINIVERSGNGSNELL